VSSQLSNKTAQELYVQANLIRSAITECTLAYPGGGGDLDGNGTVDAADNPNTPFPLNPSGALNNALAPATTFSNDNARNLGCIVSSSAKKLIFQGSGSQGRFLPPPPPGYSEWNYANDASGVRITITAPASATDATAMAKLLSRFDVATCQASFAANVFTVWLQKAACP
jgi:hypothetical protein